MKQIDNILNWVLRRYPLIMLVASVVTISLALTESPYAGMAALATAGLTIGGIILIANAS